MALDLNISNRRYVGIYQVSSTIGHPDPILKPLKEKVLEEDTFIEIAQKQSSQIRPPRSKLQHVCSRGGLSCYGNSRKDSALFAVEEPTTGSKNFETCL